MRRVAAGAFHPEHLGFDARERIFFHQLRRRVSTTGIGDALIGTEEIRAVNKALGRRQGIGLLVVPEVINVFHDLYS